MKRLRTKILILLSLVLFSAIFTHGASILVVGINGEESPSFMESISVVVNCTTAELTIHSTIYSEDPSLAHFPSEIDMSRSELTNALSIIIVFSRFGSGLVIVFNNTDATTARSLADTVKGSIEEAFNTSFTWNSTEIDDSYVYVKYIGPEKGELSEYLSWLMGKCLASDLGGFTSTFIPMSSEENAFIEVSANKEEGSFDWTYHMTVGYTTNIPTGMGPHKIDILDLLNVESLAPSEYASYEGLFTSTILFIVLSNETVSYVSSEPGLVNPPMQLKGWLINSIPPQPPVRLMAQFSFANDPTPIDKLSLTFSGLIIPEFTVLTPLIPLMLITSAILAIKRRGLNPKDGGPGRT